MEAAAFLNGRVEQLGSGPAVIGFSLGAYYALDLAAGQFHDPEPYERGHRRRGEDVGDSIVGFGAHHYKHMFQ